MNLMKMKLSQKKYPSKRLLKTDYINAFVNSKMMIIYPTMKMTPMIKTKMMVIEKSVPQKRQLKITRKISL